MNGIRTCARLVLMGLAVIGAQPLLAQPESALLARVQPNLGNPGGKSLSMGGAFVSLADDATAAFANPAGLTQIPAFEVAISGKRFDTSPLLETGNFFMSSTGAGYQFLGMGDAYTASNRSSEMEFLGIVGPITKNLSFGLYRAVNLNYRLDAGSGNSSIFHDYRLFAINIDNSTDMSWSLDEQGAISLKNEAYGLSLAYDFGALSVGAGLTLNRFSFTMDGGDYSPAHTLVVNRGFGTRELAVDMTSNVSSGSRLGWSIGARWQVLERMRLTLGGVYRRSPRFDVDYQMRYYQPGTQGVTYTCGDDPTQCGSFKVPDDWSLGVSIQPTRFLTLAFDLQRVLYSQWDSTFTFVFRYQGCTDVIPIDACTVSTPSNVGAYVHGSTPDATIPRLGAEYRVPISTSTLFLRGGYYREPAHNTRYTTYKADGPRVSGNPVTIQTPPFSFAFETVGNNVAAQSHGTVGLGATLGSHFSVDLAADLSSQANYYVLSAFYRFR